MTSSYNSLVVTQNELARRLHALAEARRAIVVGLGNVGSRLVLELPLVGVKELLLVDHDWVSVRNTRCCSAFGSADVARSKVDVLAERLRQRFDGIEVSALSTALAEVGLERLRDMTPAILVGAVDSRRARYELAGAARRLGMPLVDLGIAQMPDDVQARVQVTWMAVKPVDPLKAWTARDWHLIEHAQPCAAARRERDDDRPVASSISATLAAALGAAEVGKLLVADTSNLGYEIRIALNNHSLIRVALPASGPSPRASAPGRERSSASVKSQRRAARISEDLRALDALAQRSGTFSVERRRPWLVFRYTDTPGLVETKSGLSICTAWTARVLLGPRYPLASPKIFLAPAESGARPFHPNVLPKPPYAVCYGRHVATLLLDELARHIRRIIQLEPTAVMTDERDALNHRACRSVRRLIAEGFAPLRLGVSLPTWCAGHAATGVSHEHV